MKHDLFTIFIMSIVSAYLGISKLRVNINIPVIYKIHYET